MKKRIVLIGAGSAQFGYGTIGDILQSKVLEGSEIVLHDINFAAAYAYAAIPARLGLERGDWATLMLEKL